MNMDHIKEAYIANNNALAAWAKQNILFKNLIEVGFIERFLERDKAIYLRFADTDELCILFVNHGKKNKVYGILEVEMVSDKFFSNYWLMTRLDG